RLSALSLDQAGLSLPGSSQLSLCRELLGQCRGESVLYISNSSSLHLAPIHNRTHCVLEKNDLGTHHQTLRSGKEIPQPTQHQVPQPAEANSEAMADS
ncbi:hypothetical protein CR513_31557, partial [Mucuna pruriens]